ncbi:uncharacterized protein LOC124266723 [Haliotis rubra]|uniref:uncharacterized protein LOC124266723 n=1 Tax=Haliotis rubra TaxID=36100 RepID=UPI001EE54BEA|nr:uncharacterized protein LOC124266723 [Haliotis rubra]
MQSAVCLIVLTVGSVAGDNNLALLRPANHSMNIDYTGQGPERAVDGFNITGPQCTYVEVGGSYAQPGWWQVDLQVTVRVGRVRITPAEYPHGIPNKFRLDVFQDPQCPNLCAEYNGRFTEAVAETVYCSTPVRGRFVRFTQDSPIFLCEVEVYESREQEETVRDAQFVKQPGKKVVLPNPHEVQTTSVLQCARSCLEYGSCPFFNYSKLGGICEISYNVSSSSDITVDAPGWSVFEQNVC